MFKRNTWLIFVAFIWILIFALPPLRSRLVLMWQGGPQTSFTVVPSGYLKNFWPMLSQQNPRDAALQFMSIVAHKSTFTSAMNVADLPRIDQLIQQHPETKWLPAIRLLMTVSAFRTNRLGGELSDTNYLDNLKNGKPSPEISSTVKRNFSNNDLDAALRICKLGEKREP